MEIFVDDESKLTLHGLQQYYCKIDESDKTGKLTDMLDALDFNQVVIFVRSQDRASQLDKLLRKCQFPSVSIYGRMKQDERWVCWRSPWILLSGAWATLVYFFRKVWLRKQDGGVVKQKTERAVTIPFGPSSTLPLHTHVSSLRKTGFFNARYAFWHLLLCFFFYHANFVFKFAQ